MKNRVRPILDNDQDGICDSWVRAKGLEGIYSCESSDKCPMIPEDKDGFEDLDGCPDSDNDADGICDPWVAKSGKAAVYATTCTGSDTCPNIPEDKDGFEDADGCPDADNDGDKICDPWVVEQGELETYATQCKGADQCPDQPETYNSFMDEDGCPDELKIVLRGVQFVYNKDKILPESLPILDEVVEILAKHPHVEKVRIDGHTDSRGSARYNRKLSDKRAKAVVEYLKSKGIASSRMTSKGFGEDKLLVKPEKSEEDYQTNRRVEFVILKMGKPSATPHSD